jgi:UDP-MurNAc hydroxylase
MRITFINHACVKIEFEQFALLCDPWIDSSAFNFGWDLLVKTPLGLDKIMEAVKYIFVSHEHPDHFVPKFFADIHDRWSNRVSILFHETQDKRVKNFCQARGFRVVELRDRTPYPVGNGIEAICGRHHFYDSWLYLSKSHRSLLNINDCQIHDKGELEKLARALGPLDVLLTQFSYAAWKGGHSNDTYREAEARRKLINLGNQVKYLRPRWTIPFASMMYFSNQENFYMNDRMNTPRMATDAIIGAGGLAVAMFPGDQWEVGETRDNRTALDAWDEVYQKRCLLPLRGPGESVSLDVLAAQFKNYRKRVLARNSRLFIHLLRYLPIGGVFRPVKIHLSDLDATVSVSVVDGFELVSDAAAHVRMHSSSLAFIFNYEFGYDTLLVNGRFEATAEGFSRMSKSLAVGLLNAMGMAVSPRLALNPNLIRLVFSKLGTIRSQLAAA